MRPASYYYMAQVWPARRDGQSEHGAGTRTSRLGRRTHTPRHAHPGRERLTVARRLLAVLNGTSQPA
jgi:hypothetical protein